MRRGGLYWLIVILWILSIIGAFNWPAQPWFVWGNHIVELLLFILIGWDLYGPMLTGGPPRVA